MSTTSCRQASTPACCAGSPTLYTALCASLRAHGFEDLQFAALRQAAGRQFSAVEITADALVLIEENLLVHFLEIECEIQRPAHPRIRELLAANIHRERLHAAGTAVGKLFL